MATSRSRRPKGTPVGGQFAPEPPKPRFTDSYFHPGVDLNVEAKGLLKTGREAIERGRCSITEVVKGTDGALNAVAMTLDGQPVVAVRQSAHVFGCPWPTSRWCAYLRQPKDRMSIWDESFTVTYVQPRLPRTVPAEWRRSFEDEGSAWIGIDSVHTDPMSEALNRCSPDPEVLAGYVVSNFDAIQGEISLSPDDER